MDKLRDSEKLAKMTTRGADGDSSQIDKLMMLRSQGPHSAFNYRKRLELKRDRYNVDDLLWRIDAHHGVN